MRVALASPLTSARALTTAFRDCTDVDRYVLSRGTIGSSKDVFAEVVRRMRLEVASKAVVGASLHAQAGGWPLQSIVLTHIHDEASLRLRSSSTERLSALIEGEQDGSLQDVKRQKALLKTLMGELTQAAKQNFGTDQIHASARCISGHRSACRQPQAPRSRVHHRRRCAAF